MIRLLLLVALFFGTLSVEGGGEVVAATDADFSSIISKAEIALVKFYAPWCGHCQKLAPEWEKAAKEIPSEAVMVDVDCTKEKELSAKYSIQGYPTIILFRNGEEVEHYKGARKSADIINYVKANVGAAVVYTSSAEELAKIKDEESTVCVAVTSDAESALAKTLDALAHKFRMKMKLVVFTDPKILPGEKEESVIIFRKGGEKEVFDGAIDEKKLNAFLEIAFLPFAGEISPTTYLNYVEVARPIAWVLLKPNEEASKKVRKQLVDLGKKVRQHVVLLWADAEQYAVAGSLDVPDDAKYPAFVIVQRDEHHVHPPSEPATAESMERFILDFSTQKTSPVLKSQPVPELETVDGLTTIVGKTLDKYLSSEKDLLIEFYAPWCGHCKKLAPTYAKLAKKFESSDVIVAALDATANHVDKSLFDISGYPTIYFVPHGQAPIAYEGDRSFEDLEKFLLQHSSATKDASKPEEVKNVEIDEERSDL